MELVEGRSLADAVKEDGRVEPTEAARIGLWVLRALRAAHSAGVLHRDVKPGNVLLSHDGRVLLTDFGIAQIEGDSTITRTGEVVGSVDYLAPERVRGQDPGPSSDLWALGATLYTAVEGRSPFRRTSPLTTLQAVVEEEAADPRYSRPARPGHHRPAAQGPGHPSRHRRDRAAPRGGGRGPAAPAGHRRTCRRSTEGPTARPGGGTPGRTRCPTRRPAPRTFRWRRRRRRPFPVTPRPPRPPWGRRTSARSLTPGSPGRLGAVVGCWRSWSSSPRWSAGVRPWRGRSGTRGGRAPAGPRRRPPRRARAPPQGRVPPASRAPTPGRRSTTRWASGSRSPRAGSGTCTRTTATSSRSTTRLTAASTSSVSPSTGPPTSATRTRIRSTSNSSSSGWSPTTGSPWRRTSTGTGRAPSGSTPGPRWRRTRSSPGRAARSRRRTCPATAPSTRSTCPRPPRTGPRRPSSSRPYCRAGGAGFVEFRPSR